jgi:hypothetical protein
MKIPMTSKDIGDHISLAFGDKDKIDNLLSIMAREKVFLNVKQAVAVLAYDWMYGEEEIKRVLDLCDEDALLYALTGRVPYDRAARISRLRYIIDLLNAREESRWWVKFNTIGFAVWTLSQQSEEYGRELVLHVPGLAWYVYYEGETDYQTGCLTPWIKGLIEGCPDSALAWSLFEERRSDGVSNGVELAKLLRVCCSYSAVHTAE